MSKKVATQILSGGKAVIEQLKVENVSCVFGLIGSATMELFDALYDEKRIRFIDVRDERTGTHMADGYARASGKPGIIIAGQNGPGATNLVTGIAQAKAAFSPVISIAGDITSEHKGKDAFQEVDQQSLFDPITKKTFSINKTNLIPKIINKAFCLALSLRQGPVHINLPRDILSKKSNFLKFTQHNRKKINNVKIKDLKKILHLVTASKKPVIIAGGGIKNSQNYKQVMKFAKTFQIPVVSSPGHADAIPFAEQLYAGQMGPRGNPIASKYVKQADLILALGTRLGFNSTFYSYENINKEAKIIQIDAELISIGRHFPVKIGICCDVKDLMFKLNSLSPKYKNLYNSKLWIKDFLKQKKEYYRKRDEEADIYSSPIKPSGLFKTLRDIMPINSAVTLDAGTLCLQATDMLNFNKPRTFFTPLDFGLVGFSFACGLGIKLAKPKTPVFSLMGDGGFGMTISELSTAVHHNINTITLILNNNSWGAEKAYQRDYYNKRYIGADIKNPPFHKLAELYGAKGYYVKKLDNLKKVIKEALNCNKPVVINIEMDPDALFSFRKDSFKHKTK
tara:strand:+ start:730 stop:2427 length:1698 start_codon:yes stop_codon:yes gene_type:complete